MSPPQFNAEDLTPLAGEAVFGGRVFADIIGQDGVVRVSLCDRRLIKEETERWTHTGTTPRRGGASTQ